MTKHQNYSNTFGETKTERGKQTVLGLLNSCKIVKKDSLGEYVWTATECSDHGIVKLFKDYNFHLNLSK